MTITLFVAVRGLAQTGPGSSGGAHALAPHRGGEVLVKFRGGASARSRAAAHARVGARTIESFNSVAGLEHVRLPANVSVEEAIQRYGADSSVAYAEPNYIVTATALPDDPNFDLQWGLHNEGSSGGLAGADIDAPEAWDVTTGDSSVVVAIIDSGIDYDHVDLAANVFSNPDDCDADGVDDDLNTYIDDCHGIDAATNDSDPDDSNGHGTHVAGTIGAMSNNDTGVAGVAHHVTLLACRFLDTFGNGTVSGAIRCFDYVRSWKLRGLGIAATNNSWGAPAPSYALADAIAEQRAANILTVIAAGNSGTTTASYPGAIEDAGIISVAATTRTDGLASFSNRGRGIVHMGAPGDDILSTSKASHYKSMSGTSMAAPHVTGVAALLAAQNPSRDWIALRNLVLASGDPILSLANTTSGRRLNAHRALTCTSDTLLTRHRPADDLVIAAAGVPLALSAYHVTCAAPAGPVDVSVSPGGTVVTLNDGGTGQDQVAGDGLYAGQWTPGAVGGYTLTFPGGDVVTVNVSNDIFVGPGSNVFDGFGEALDANDDLLLVGAPRDDTAAPDAGAAYLYDATTGALLHTFVSPSPQPDDAFGDALDIADGVAAIGAPLADVAFEDEGAAFLFDATSGALLHAFANPTPKTSDWFGSSVAVVGDAVLVGAGLDDTEEEDAGLVYVFDRGTGSLAGTLNDPLPFPDEHFGFSVAALTGRAAITTFDDNDTLSRVREYDADPSSLTFGAMLRTYDTLPLSGQGVLTFTAGFSLASSGTRLLMGDPVGYLLMSAPANLIQSGTAFMYSTNTGAFLGSFSDPAPSSGNAFGWSVGLYDRWAIVGAPASDVIAGDGGVAYLFDAETGDLRRRLSPPAADAVDFAGETVALSAAGSFVGVVFDDTAQVDGGAVHRFGQFPLIRGAQKCYRAAGEEPGDDIHEVSDVFDDTDVVLFKPTQLCEGVARDTFANADPDRRMVCYDARLAPGAPHSVARTIRYADTHGTFDVALSKMSQVCLPASESAGPVSALNDHYTCYRAKRAPHTSRFTRKSFRLSDDLEDKTFETLKPSTFCTATEFDGTGAGAPEDHLACYRVRRAHGEPRFADATVGTEDALLAQTLTLTKPETLCFPATILAQP